MDEDNVVHMHNRTLFSCMEKRNYVICMKMHPFHEKHNMKQGDPGSVSSGYFIYTYMAFWLCVSMWECVCAGAHRIQNRGHSPWSGSYRPSVRYQICELETQCGSFCKSSACSYLLSDISRQCTFDCS